MTSTDTERVGVVPYSVIVLVPQHLRYQRR
ncbi:hypothetical protein JOJ87_004656 [Rhodococcus ruber]|nr:hypothetical protein [Rhodococcus ruber]